MKQYLAIDIGGTFIKYGLIGQAEVIQEAGKRPTPVNENKAIVQTVKSIVNEQMQETDLSGIGISTAGIVDRKRGEIIYAGPTIIDYIGTNFKDELAYTNLPVHVTNDVDSALLGEIWRANHPLDEAVFCLTLGTGIGGAYYKQGLQSGAHLQAHSIGYLLYDEADETTYEMRASTSALNDMIAKDLSPDLSTIDFFDLAKANDPAALAILTSWANEVARGIAQIILIIDPERIIIGGGISAQGDYLLKVIEEEVQRHLPPNFMKTKLSIAKEKNDAALYGAVFGYFNPN